MNDKINHIAAGVLVAVVVGLFPYLATNHLGVCLWAAITSAIIAGGVKEWCDMRTEGNKWDLWDFLATCLGAVIVAVFIIMLHYGKG